MFNNPQKAWPSFRYGLEELFYRHGVNMYMAGRKYVGGGQVVNFPGVVPNHCHFSPQLFLHIYPKLVNVCSS